MEETKKKKKKEQEKEKKSKNMYSIISGSDKRSEDYDNAGSEERQWFSGNTLDGDSGMSGDKVKIWMKGGSESCDYLKKEQTSKHIL